MNPPKCELKDWLAEDGEGFWTEYKETGSVEMRNVLVENFLPLVNYHAERLGAKLHDKLDLDDLKQVGIFGLIQAIDNFDLERGFKFETYCAMRIRGAILDDLRANDWVPRLVRQRSNQLEKAFRELEEQYGRQPADEEVAKHLGMNMDDYHDLAREASAVSMLSLNESINGDDEDNPQKVDLMCDQREMDPLDKLEMKDALASILRELNHQEKLVVKMYYFDELTMKEIGAVLEISESRVSQIHSKLINQLRFRYGKKLKRSRRP